MLIMCHSDSSNVQLIAIELGIHYENSINAQNHAQDIHAILANLCDTIYIKTQVFSLLRYYSTALRNIVRSDWVTRNITHNMTSSLI